ncbi:MAG: VOC family protein [Methylococcales bacterium]
MNTDSGAFRLTPFQLSVQVRDIGEARTFYAGVLGCGEGRSDTDWVDFNLFGHQLVCHLNPAIGKSGTLKLHANPVDRHSVPAPHFGVVLEMQDWRQLADCLRDQGVTLLIEPQLRFQNQPGEQATPCFFWTRLAMRLNSRRFGILPRSCSIPGGERSLSSIDLESRIGRKAPGTPSPGSAMAL